MENRNEKVQKLNLAQMEQFSGGVGGGNHPVICSKCRQVFRSPDEFAEHIPGCPGKTVPRVVELPEL